MKNIFLIVVLSLVVLGLKSQELTPLPLKESNSVIQSITQNTTKTYGDIFWEEDFNKDKWFNTVVVDNQGYLLDTNATLPKGWTSIDSTNNNNFWHWSDVGPRGAYTQGDDNDPFTPDNDLLEALPEGTTTDNGFMLLESDYFNTTTEGELVTSPIEMNSYIEFGPLDFSDKKGVMFNCKILDRLCCHPDNLVGLYISRDHNSTLDSGNWDVFKLNTHTNPEYTRDKDIHINISKATAGYDSVYFRIGKSLASHFFVFIDDIKFYEPHTNDMILRDGFADYMYNAEDSDYSVSSTLSHNFWGGYTEIPQSIVSEFVQFRAAVYANGYADAENAIVTAAIFKDGVADTTFTSSPKTIYAYVEDTLRVNANYIPADIAHYQVSMTVSMDSDDENTVDNGWNYEFEVTNGSRYSRVRHGMEDDFDYAGPRDWASGGNDGDACVQRFTFPESAGDVKVRGVSVYIDDYTDRDDEIEAIKNGEFSMIARLYKLNENDSIIDTGISSESYLLAISDTGTWLTLDFVDEGNLLIDAGLYYAGIEIYTGNVDYRFQIGDDVNAPKQPNAGGLVYLTSQNGWYWTGDNYAIDLLLGTVDVTFNVIDVDYLIEENDTVYLTGNFANWSEPGKSGSFEMKYDDVDDVFSVTVKVLANYVDLEYKYFLNAGWDGGEWIADPHRMITINYDNYIVDPPDCFGLFHCYDNVIDNENFKVLITPNPFNGILTINNLNNATQIILTNMLGQTIMTVPVTANKMDINTDNLEKGIYLITILDKIGNTQTEKVVKN